MSAWEKYNQEVGQFSQGVGNLENQVRTANRNAEQRADTLASRASTDLLQQKASAIAKGQLEAQLGEGKVQLATTLGAAGIAGIKAGKKLGDTIQARRGERLRRGGDQTGEGDLDMDNVVDSADMDGMESVDAHQMATEEVEPHESAVGGGGEGIGDVEEAVSSRIGGSLATRGSEGVRGGEIEMMEGGGANAVRDLENTRYGVDTTELGAMGRSARAQGLAEPQIAIDESAPLIETESAFANASGEGSALASAGEGVAEAVAEGVGGGFLGDVVAGVGAIAPELAVAGLAGYEVYEGLKDVAEGVSGSEEARQQSTTVNPVYNGLRSSNLNQNVVVPVLDSSRPSQMGGHNVAY
jgi:hypothetical protein